MHARVRPQVKASFKRRQQMFAGQADGGGDAAARAATPAWLAAHKQNFDAPPFPVAPIKASPDTEGYRNKCDFTVGPGGPAGSGRPTVGFCLGREADGSTMVAPCAGCVHVAPPMQALALALEGFLAESPLPPYRQGPHTGHWRGLTVPRSERTEETMAVVLVSTAAADPAVWAAERQRLAAALAPLTTALFVQVRWRAR